MLITGGGDGGQAKAAVDKSRKEEIEAEKKHIREVSTTSRHNVSACIGVSSCGPRQAISQSIVYF